MVESLDGTAVTLGRSGAGRAQVILWASVNCRPCAEALQAFGAFATANWPVDPIVICRGSRTAVRTLTAQMPTSVSIVVDADGRLGTAYQVATTPLTLIIGADGVVGSKGPATALSGFESLAEEGLARGPELTSRVTEITPAR
jgi:hypothetical protein